MPSFINKILKWFRYEFQLLVFIVKLIILSAARSCNNVNKDANEAADEVTSFHRYLNDIEVDYYNDPLKRGCVEVVEQLVKV